MNRYLLIVSIVFAAMTVSFADARTDSAPRPNILYFYVDDMGWGAIGPNGQAARKRQNLPSVLTPNLDRLAAEGINFTRAYGATVCSPARSSQQSGFHQGHTFADRNDPDNAKKAMRADDVLMGDVLSRAGYVTGYWGQMGIRWVEEQGRSGHRKCPDPAHVPRLSLCGRRTAPRPRTHLFPAHALDRARPVRSGWRLATHP